MGGGYFQFFTKNWPQKHQKRAILHTSEANGGAPLATLLVTAQKRQVSANAKYSASEKSSTKDWTVKRPKGVTMYRTTRKLHCRKYGFVNVKFRFEFMDPLTQKQKLTLAIPYFLQCSFLVVRYTVTPFGLFTVQSLVLLFSDALYFAFADTCLFWAVTSFFMHHSFCSTGSCCSLFARSLYF